MSLKHPLRQCIRHTRHDRITTLAIRTLTTTIDNPLSTAETPAPLIPSTPTASLDATPRMNPNKVSTPRSEKRLLAKQNQYPIGSRRRRAALASAHNIPFSQLPYQCFQEARNVLREDREEKVREIEMMRGRIVRLEEQAAKDDVESGRSEKEVREREHRLESMRKRVEAWKIFADINDPLVKKNFEDGTGDMNKPIYRHLADLQWRHYRRRVLVQRITQLNVTPDVLPHLEPTYSTAIRFGQHQKVPHGEFVHSRLSTRAPTLTIQPYDKGSRLVTIVVVNPDVPNVEKDGFDFRCHFLACNIPISPTDTTVDLATLDPETQVVQGWLPPYVQQGLKYQRHALVILEQDAAILNPHYIVHPHSTTDSSTTEEATTTLPTALSLHALPERFSVRQPFILRSLVDTLRLKPVGVDLFRAQFDDGTNAVMRALGEDDGVVFKRMRVEPLPYKRLKGSRFR